VYIGGFEDGVKAAIIFIRTLISSLNIDWYSVVFVLGVFATIVVILILLFIVCFMVLLICSVYSNAVSDKLFK
jgi:hypothetical protein